MIEFTGLNKDELRKVCVWIFNLENIRTRRCYKMTSIFKSVTDAYQEYMASGDPRVTPWMLMQSPGPTLTLVASYVFFVKKLGPAWMMDRKPWDLRNAMIAYNAAIVIANCYLIFESISILILPGYSWTCGVENKNDPNSIRLAELGWWFFFMKFVEFTDTLFFVLRKKNNQISTLHVVHHAVVPISVWVGLRIEPGSYNYFFPLLNTIVHTVMYTYYGLAALGPQVQKYLWWKKYLTTFQIMQFVSVLVYLLVLMAGNCRVSKFIIYLNTFLAGLFLIMFCDYYLNAYKNKTPAKDKSTIKSDSNANGVITPKSNAYARKNNAVAKCSDSECNGKTVH